MVLSYVGIFPLTPSKWKVKLHRDPPLQMWQYTSHQWHGQCGDIPQNLHTWKLAKLKRCWWGCRESESGSALDVVWEQIQVMWDVPHVIPLYSIDMGVSKNNGTPKSWVLIGFSIINHPFWRYPYHFWSFLMKLRETLSFLGYKSRWLVLHWEWIAFVPTPYCLPMSLGLAGYFLGIH